MDQICADTIYIDPICAYLISIDPICAYPIYIDPIIIPMINELITEIHENVPFIIINEIWKQKQKSRSSL